MEAHIGPKIASVCFLHSTTNSVKMGAITADSMSSQWLQGVQALDAKGEQQTNQEKAENLDRVFMGLVDTSVKKESQVVPQVMELSALEKDLKAVIASGGEFDSNGAVAARFYRELRADPKLRQKKVEATKGKGNAALKAFKAKWAATTLTKIQVKHTKTEQVIDLTTLDAEFCTVDRMWSREGGTQTALETCKNYCEQALKHYEDGELFHGHPMMKYDTFRKRMLVR